MFYSRSFSIDHLEDAWNLVLENFGSVMIYQVDELKVHDLELFHQSCDSVEVVPPKASRSQTLKTVMEAELFQFVMVVPEEVENAV
jgi:hypothetical protein